MNKKETVEINLKILYEKCIDKIHFFLLEWN